ncbi:MAG: tRNA-dihydrouridine synthase family protein [Anaerolineales bacterium]|jgi:nifR3 family TIM-barrel protein|nr:tRNA-dihydrouridine synthase family protein [Anaerolineales bacterium]MDX9935853.1 tRNA-dihydrouridine synthase family protein [Anaerolineales bacterium]GER79774.1 tRNA-dihydrouridine synthase [Candidatus Denitrolinea symbiosum]HPP63174.1 tRNA-dihydrouridine synthase family protein [Anaerolineales bacterium]
MTAHFHIRDIPIHGDAILAPMDGYSDWPFRSVCRELGSAMSYTEFVDVQKILSRSKLPLKKFHFEEAERPIAFQLYGDDPDEILEAALRAQELRPDIIDINMGCPAKTVARRGAGVGMMRSPLKIARTFRKLTAALEIPVTGKIRLGWDDCRSYRLIARIVEENGGALIALHARTKEQRYAGHANWDAIAEVKSLVKIPVIGNGDARTVADIARMKQVTGCDAVMVGRGAVANPWIFAGLDRDQVPPEEVQRVLREHLARNLAFYGEGDGQRLFRKHAIQYLMMQSLSREARKQILRARPTGEFVTFISQIHAAVQDAQAPIEGTITAA